MDLTSWLKHCYTLVQRRHHCKVTSQQCYKFKTSELGTFAAASLARDDAAVLMLHRWHASGAATKARVQAS
eukprot:1141478-Pelagomonas_calceolata.AAC.4